MTRLFRLSLSLILLALLAALAPAVGAAPPAMPPADGYLGGCTGEYFNNMTLAGSPVLVRTDAGVNFFWPEGTSPGPGVNTSQYSVRWTCSVNAPSDGNYTFTMTTDDGMNLLIDGNLIMWAWYDQGPSAYAKTVFLNAGAHTVVIQYYNDTLGGTAQVFSTLGTAASTLISTSSYPVVGVWVGQYYNNISLSGSPVFLLNTPGLNFGFNWGYGSPDPSVPVDYFSAKWDAYQNIPTTGYYTIVANSDDGVRVWLDGALVIDGWYDHSATTFTATRNLGAGLHAFHVEYYEHTGTALISVQIVPPIMTTPPICGQGIVPNLGLCWQTGGTSTGGEVIVNNLGPGWQAGGASTGWHGVATGINGHAFWTFNNMYATPYHNWARWYPTLGAPRNYQVFAYIPAGLGSTLNARYEVYHAGRYDLAPRSQAFYGNQWISLGTYNFRAAGGEFVLLSNVTSECHLCRKLAFDAIKFSPR